MTCAPTRLTSYQMINEICFQLGSKFIQTESAKSPTVALKTFICSPFSLLEAFFMDVRGRDDTSINRIFTAYRIPPKDAPVLYSALQAIRNQMLAGQLVKLSNTVAVRGIDSPVLEKLESEHRAKTYSQMPSADVVNQIVSDRTEGMIKDIVQDSDLQTTDVLLMNALYFKAFWQNQFDKDKTYPGSFEQLDGAKPTVMMMYNEKCENYKFAEYTDPHAGELYIVEMPYKRSYSNASLLVIMPKDPKKFGQWQSSLNAESFNHYRSLLQTKKISLTFPKQNISSEGELATPKDLEAVLSIPTGSFMWGGVEMKGGVKYKQKVKAEIDEEGTKAAAVTAASTSKAAGGDGIPEIVIDKPFMEIILHGDTPLFMGAIRDANGMVLSSAPAQPPQKTVSGVVIRSKPPLMWVGYDGKRVGWTKDS